MKLKAQASKEEAQADWECSAETNMKESVKQPSADAEAAEKQEEWTCKACTYLNPSENTACEICLTKKGEEYDPEQDNEENKEEEKKEEEEGADDEEEKKEEEEEPEKTQEEKESEIMANTDQKARWTEYLDFLTNLKKEEEGADDEEEVEEGEKIEGKMFTNTSLFRLLKNLHLMIVICGSQPDGYLVVQRFSNPHDLRLLVELSVEASLSNQVIVQKIFQAILKLDIPKEILDEAVRLAATTKYEGRQTRSKIAKLLAGGTKSKQSSLDFSESPFLQLIFSRIEKSRRALYTEKKKLMKGENSVLQESIRTIRALYTDPERNQGLRSLVNDAIKTALINM